MTPFRFAYSSNAYTRVTLERAIDEVADSGFDAIEILADVPHVDPRKVSAGRRKRLASRLARRSLRVSNVNANTNLALSRRDAEGFWPSLLEPDAKARRLRVDYIRRAIDFAADLGSANVAISVGRAESAPGLDERLRRALDPVLAHADRRRVNVGIEYEPGHWIESSGPLLSLIRAIRHPRLGANLDIGHAVCAGERVPAVIRRLAGRIWNLHFEDIRGRVHRHLVPGMGDIDFAAIFLALRSIDYRGYITLELYPYKSRPTWAGRKGLMHLRKVLESTGRAKG